jgi:hypothetical protein
MEKTIRVFKILKIDLPHDSAIPLPSTYAKQIKYAYERPTYTSMLIATLFTITKKLNQTKMSMDG